MFSQEIGIVTEFTKNLYLVHRVDLGVFVAGSFLIRNINNFDFSLFNPQKCLNKSHTLRSMVSFVDFKCSVLIVPLLL